MRRPWLIQTWTKHESSWRETEGDMTRKVLSGSGDTGVESRRVGSQESSSPSPQHEPAPEHNAHCKIEELELRSTHT